MHKYDFFAWTVMRICTFQWTRYRPLGGWPDNFTFYCWSPQPQMLMYAHPPGFDTDLAVTTTCVLFTVTKHKL